MNKIMRKRGSISTLPPFTFFVVALSIKLIYASIAIYAFLPTSFAALVRGELFIYIFACFLYFSFWVAGWTFLYIDFLLEFVFIHIVSYWGFFGFITRFHVLFEATPTESKEYLLSFVLKDWIFWISLIVVGLFTVLFLMDIKSRKSAQFPAIFFPGVWVSIVVIFAFLWFNIFYVHPPILVATHIYKAYQDVQNVHKREKWLQQSPSPSINCDFLEGAKIVIFIGESANRDFMSIYGYDNSSTPFLNSLFKQRKALIARGISPGNLTRISFPIILTEVNPLSYNHFPQSHSVVGLLKACNFKVYWYSNQELIGEYTAGSYSVGSEADRIVYSVSDPNRVSHYSFHPHDNVLIEMFREDQQILQADRNANQVFIFHLLGSHMDYSKRYPLSRSLISPPSSMIDHYVNTIYYTDWVINILYTEIANLFGDSSPILAFYFADHGEIVTNERWGRGFDIPYQDEFRAPFIVWNNGNNMAQGLQKEVRTFIESGCRQGGLNLAFFYDLMYHLLDGDGKIVQCNMSKVLFLNHIIDYFNIEAITEIESPNMMTLLTK